MADTGENYIRLPGPAFWAWENPSHLPNDDFEVGLSFFGRKGSGADPVISVGLICYPQGAVVGSDQAGTWVPLLLDTVSISDTTDTLHTVRASVSIGNIPAGTKEIVEAIRVHSGEVMMGQLKLELFGDVLGGVIRHQETVTANLAQAISEYNAVFGENAANALTLIRSEANSEFSQTLFVINQEAIFGPDAANATAYIDNRADSVLTSSTLAQNLNAAFGPNAGNALNVIDTQATSVFTSSATYQNLNAAFGLNASNIQGYVDARTNAALTSSALYQNLESEFGPNAANLSIFAQTVADLDGSAVRRTVTGTGGGGSFSYGGFVNPDGSAFFATADQIVNLAGDAFFQLTSDRALLNVPIDVQRVSDVASMGSPNAAFWVGDPTIPINARTPQNSTFGSDNGTPLIGGDVYVKGGIIAEAFAAGTGEVDLTATTDEFMTRGGTMKAGLVFTASSFLYRQDPNRPNPIATMGTVQLTFEYSEDGGVTFTPVAPGTVTRTGTNRLSRTTVENTEINPTVWEIGERFEWTERFDTTFNLAPGTDTIWRALARNVGNFLPTHTVAIRLDLRVTET